jgi:hypothetical protein
LPLLQKIFPTIGLLSNSLAPSTLFLLEGGKGLNYVTKQKIIDLDP